MLFGDCVLRTEKITLHFFNTFMLEEVIFRVLAIRWIGSENFCSNERPFLCRKIPPNSLAQRTHILRLRFSSLELFQCFMAGCAPKFDERSLLPKLLDTSTNCLHIVHGCGEKKRANVVCSFVVANPFSRFSSIAIRLIYRPFLEVAYGLLFDRIAADDKCAESGPCNQARSRRS